MKTVMKKMFCLMLVAVLLVSAVPTAFAEGAPSTITCTTHPDATACLSAELTIQPTCTDDSVYVYWCFAEGAEHSLTGAAIPATGHTPGNAATCNTAQTCTVCGATVTEALGHDFQNGKCQRTDCGFECTHNWSEGVLTKAPTCTENGELSYTCSICDHVHKDTTTHESVQKTDHTPGAAATCTEPQKCTVCGGTLANAKKHNPGPAATCTSAQTCLTCGEVLDEALGHDYEGGECKNEGCDSSETGTHEVYFSVNGNQKFWHLGVKHNATVAEPGFKYGTTYEYLEQQVGDTDTQEFRGWSKNPSDTNGSKLEDIVKVPVTESVTYYAIYQAKQTTTTPDNSNNNDNSDNDDNDDDDDTTVNYPTGSHTLKVWANIYIGTTLEKTIEMDTKATGVSGSAKIVDVMAALRSDLNAEVKSDKFSAYHGLDWDTQDYYYKVKDGEYKPVSNRLTVGEENKVYINLYSAEKLVVVNVHTRKSYSTDLSIRIRGKRVDDTVTYDDVKDAVKKYYNVSSLSIYEYDEWCNVVEGDDASKTYDFKVREGDNIYEVYISGSRKSGTYTYTADSTNPKTGDMIFAPVMIMGASVTALAVLFFLNKKRAVK